MRDLTKLAAVPLLMMGVAGCDLLGSKKGGETKTTTTTKTASPQSKLCASNATYAKLKESAFDEAKRIRERDTEALDALSDASVVRMENPLLESSDEALGLTVCSGRMVLELPPGAGAAFNGRQRLAADVTYSAQAAADGSGTVYKIDGGEPIVYRLASFDPRRGSTRTASIEGEGLEAPEPAEPAPAERTSVEPRVVVIDERPAPPTAPRPPRAAAEAVTEADVQEAELAAERARRVAAERAARAAAAASKVRTAAAAAAEARAERAEAAERRARAERVVEARRIERGERVEQREDRPVRTARPSFNCRYARSRVERMICGSPDLAARDRRMAALYYRTNDGADPVVRRRLSASRLRFLAYRDRCPDAGCVAAAYEDRMDEIVDLADE